ncbi:DUF4190 domain-containing protein [Bacillus sp. FJAT-49736]|uniref:DUF4190 domain-containing protein n=1 Tax=Bacillus sp. FJAT-49736 TaxID=2833582 RepID=UPI001BCA1B6D|nr:DUF4190 domain-containing protein [Bacillus sp. FJAT-49736]MBS4174250.1 DUF4190 domain-containing protein [Bacillus sp. FJAT-49736]
MSNENQQTIIVQKPEGNGLAVASLVLGIVGVVLNLIPFLPYVIGALAIIFGAVGIKKPIKKGMSIAGIILGVIAIVMKILFWMGIAVLGNL